MGMPNNQPYTCYGKITISLTPKPGYSRLQITPLLCIPVNLNNYNKRMENIMILLLFLILPVSTIFLCMVKDNNRTRKNFLNFILIANTLVFMFPIAYAFFATSSGGNMWDENGPGVMLWLYMLILPLCGIIQFILLLLKIVFYQFGKPRAIKN